MVKQVNYGSPVVFPFAAKEGNISIVDAQTATGTIKAPSVATPLNKGDLVEIADDLTVAALDSGVCIGTVYNEGKWVNGEPREAMTQAAAVTADALREIGVETFFKKIITVAATGSISAGDYVAPSSSGFAAAQSNAGFIALTAIDADDQIIVGVL